jgi:hypothetical protein
MVRHHHRIAPAIALTLALAAAAPASAMFERNPPPSGVANAGTPTSTGPCSEVCSTGGYTSLNQTATASAKTGAALPHDPRPRADALSHNRSSTADSAGLGAGNTGPRSEAVSASGYGNPTAPSTAVRVAPSSSFDWGDAGIGAGSAVALTILLLGGAFGATKLRRRPTRSSAQPTT